jgi:ketosteroid isomerase-like protein
VSAEEVTYASFSRDGSGPSIGHVVYDGGRRGDITSFKDSLADDFELFVPPYLPWGGHFDEDEYVALLPTVASALDFTRLRYQSLVAEGSHVVALIEIGVQGADETIMISEHWDVAANKATVCAWPVSMPRSCSADCTLRPDRSRQQPRLTGC